MACLTDLHESNARRIFDEITHSVKPRLGSCPVIDSIFGRAIQRFRRMAERNFTEGAGLIRITFFLPRMEEMGTKAFAMALYASPVAKSGAVALII